MDGIFLGKILSARFGPDPDYNDKLALFLEFRFNGGGTDWVLHDLNKIRDTMLDAQASDISKLVNKPIQVEIAGNGLVDWRILTEVL